jgi:hypothetical protein
MDFRMNNQQNQNIGIDNKEKEKDKTRNVDPNDPKFSNLDKKNLNEIIHNKDQRPNLQLENQNIGKNF